MSKASAAHEEAMQAGAERERKRRAHGTKGAEEVEDAPTKAGAGADVKAKATGGGRCEGNKKKEKEKAKAKPPPSDSIVGAPPGPKSEEADGQPWNG